MLIVLKSAPQVPDRSIIVACIRACVWASVEGRPFCVLRST